MNEITQILAFVAMLCTGADHCSVIPKPIYKETGWVWEDKTYLVEICRKGAQPMFKTPRKFGEYTIESVIKPYMLCSVHNRPDDELDKLNKQEVRAGCFVRHYAAEGGFYFDPYCKNNPQR